MKYIRHILPLLAILVVMITFLQLFCFSIVNSEEERCWQELESAVNELNHEIQIKFMDEISKLHLISTIMTNSDIPLEDISYLHIDKVQPGTMFTRIDVLYPDNTILSNGNLIEVDDDISFDKIKSKGEYLTNRKTDFLTGDPCVYYVLPIINDNDISAVLIGVIRCDTLNELFLQTLYNGEANICIIDSEDGNYIMDNWHPELGNMYEIKDRQLLPEYANVNFKEEIANLRSGTIAFVSQTTGEDIYMYYAPLDIFGWETAVFTHEDVIFANLKSLKREFLIAGIIESALLIIYCLSYVYVVKNLKRTNKGIRSENENLKILSYRDTLTNLYNRRKYFEIVSSYAQNNPAEIGIVYVDLNGLKQINDLQSHDEGDRYICTASEILTNIFGENCYRIGGDEFVVLIADIKEIDFKNSVETLKNSAAQKNISLSIGFLWQEACDNIDEMISIAEKEMYVHKKEYYKEQALHI